MTVLFLHNETPFLCFPTAVTSQQKPCVDGGQSHNH